MRLFCFHHAGGSASIYRNWPKLMSPSIEPIAVQLPGRENRILERPYDHIEPLVDALVTALRPVCDARFAFFGHSMGARVALAVTRALTERRLPLPRALFVASSSAPSLEIPVRGWNEPNEELIAYVRDIGGTPEEIISDPENMDNLLPVLRADLTVIGTCRYQPAPALSLPIHGFAGRDDPLAPTAQMRPWALETAASFTLDEVEGGHFFSPAGQDRVVDAVCREIASLAH
jgi:surfactin synthase thioesterase subunit